jgi:hypothetical protein
MDESRRRRAENEAVFREVNERIEGLQRAFAATAGEELHIVCECDRLDCNLGLDVPAEVYERTRRDSARFLVSPGHEDDAVEDVVDSGGNYVVVRKKPGEPERVAAETDPRA